MRRNNFNMHMVKSFAAGPRRHNQSDATNNLRWALTESKVLGNSLLLRRSKVVLPSSDHIREYTYRKDIVMLGIKWGRLKELIVTTVVDPLRVYDIKGY